MTRRADVGSAFPVPCCWRSLARTRYPPDTAAIMPPRGNVRCIMATRVTVLGAEFMGAGMGRHGRRHGADSGADAVIAMLCDAAAVRSVAQEFTAQLARKRYG